MVKTTELQTEVVVKHNCLLGEGPIWDINRNIICWVDILQGEIHEFSPQQQSHRTIKVNQMVGCIANCTNDHYIASLQNGFAFINKESGEVTPISDPEVHLPGNRFNDGKCDPAGRFWAGTMAFSEEPNAGNVYVLETDLSVSKKIEKVSVSNGMAWSSDHQTFYYIDTPTFEVSAYDYDKNTGYIKNKKTAIKVPEEDGYPDGMTIDNEGMLWIGHWDGWQVTRWNPHTGQKLQNIRMPVARVTSCTFGGNDLDDLYITTASTGLTEEQLQQQPLAGALFVVRKSGFKGEPPFQFKA